MAATSQRRRCGGLADRVVCVDGVRLGMLDGSIGSLGMPS
jgi:hypothetical protein